MKREIVHRGQGSLEALIVVGVLMAFIAGSLTLLPGIVTQSGKAEIREAEDQEIQNTLTDLRAAVEYDPAARAQVTKSGPVTYTVQSPVVSGTPRPIQITIVPSATKIDITASLLGINASLEATIDPEAPAPQSTLLAPPP